MHQWLIDHLLFAPQTIMQMHRQGPAATFIHSRGNEGRIDFSLLSEDLRSDGLRTYVTDIDLALHRPASCCCRRPAHHDLALTTSKNKAAFVTAIMPCCLVSTTCG